MTEEFRSHAFDPHAHDVDGFACGVDELDSWLRQHAASATSRGTARTWVWLDGHEKAVAYYSLAAHKVAREDVSARFGCGGPVEIPAVLLAKLAIDVSRQGERLGPLLVADAMARVVHATRTVGARLVVVDAISESVAAFYEHVGFRRIPGSLRLVQRVSDIAAAMQ